jgi:hypothetical protein
MNCHAKIFPHNKLNEISYKKIQEDDEALKKITNEVTRK